MTRSNLEEYREVEDYLHPLSFPEEE